MSVIIDLTGEEETMPIVKEESTEGPSLESVVIEEEPSTSNEMDDEKPLLPNDEKIGVISFHWPYMSVEKHDMIDVENDERRLAAHVVKAVYGAVGGDEADHKLDMQLDGLWADAIVTRVGGASEFDPDSWYDSHMFEVCVTVSAPVRPKKSMDCLLYLSSKMFRFGRRGQRYGRYISTDSGIRADNMKCMHHIVSTLFCVPCKNEN